MVVCDVTKEPKDVISSLEDANVRYAYLFCFLLYQKEKSRIPFFMRRRNLAKLSVVVI